MEDGDECFDLDNLEYAPDFGSPTDHSLAKLLSGYRGF